MAPATPRWANSRAVARPRPVAPPVTTTTRPWIVSARRCCWVCGSVAGVVTRVASRAAVSQGVVGVKLSNLCSKLNIGKARRNLGAMNRLLAVLVWGGIAVGGAAAFGVLELSRGEKVDAAGLLAAGRRNVRGAGAVARRKRDRLLAPDGGAVQLCGGIPLLQPVPRRSRLRAGRPPRPAHRAA